MSIHDEYKDLEARLRQSKPQTEPLPPAFKRQVRHELMEQITMNDNRFSFRKLSMALGGLILLIGIPVFFWLAQMSIGGTTNPGAAPNQGQELDPTRPTPTVATDIVLNGVEETLLEPSNDSVWVVSTSIPQGETIGRYDTINLTVGYELVSVENAKVLVKLFDGPRGVLTVEGMVSGASGTADFSLPLTELEEVTGESVDLQLNVLLQNTAPGSLSLLNLYLDNGWTVDLTVEPPITTAEIIQIGKPRPVEVQGLPEGNYYEVDLTVTYSLADFDEAVLVTGYEYSSVSGGMGGTNATPIYAGEGGETLITLTLQQSLLDDNGEIVEEVNFFAHINYYDETAAQWVNIYPGNIELSENEQNISLPQVEDVLFIESVGWTAGESEQPSLNVILAYNLVSQPTAEIALEVTGTGGTMFASSNMTIEQGDGIVTLPLPLDQPLIDGEPVLQVSAVLTAGEVEIRDDQSVPVKNQMSEGENNVWVVSTNVVTHTTENGVAADITLMVGYNLSSEYSGGRITFSNQFQASTNGGGSGGGGGSESVILPGSGATEFNFRFETASWVAAQEWLNRVSLALNLFAITNDGAQILIAETSRIGTD